MRDFILLFLFFHIHLKTNEIRVNALFHSNDAIIETQFGNIEARQNKNGSKSIQKKKDKVKKFKAQHYSD